MAGGPLSKQKSEAGKRGWLAAGGWGVTSWLGFRAVFGDGSWFLLLLGLGAACVLTWRWFQYRAKWGMRF